MSDYDQADFYFKRAEAGRENNQHEKAIELYTLAINYCKDERTVGKFLAPALLGRGESYWALDQYVKSISDCDKIIEISPNRAKVWTLRGECYLELGDLDKAQGDLTIALELDPEYVGALQLLSEVYRMKKEFQLGLDCISNCFTYGAVYSIPMRWSYYQSGRLNMEAGYFNNAIADFRTALECTDEEMPQETIMRNWALLGKSYRLRNQQGDLDAGLRAINKAIDQYSQTGWLWAERGMVYKQMGKIKVAIEDFRKALSYDKSLADAQKALEECMKISGEYQIEEKALGNPKDELHESARNDIIANGDSDAEESFQKEQAYRDLIAKSPNDVDTQLDFGTFLMNEYDLDKAEAIFRSVVQSDPKNKKAYFPIIEVLMKNRKPRGAKMFFRLARQHHLDDGSLSVHLAKLQIDEGFWDEAEKLCAHTILNFPDLADAYYYFAKALQVQERWQDAEIAFHKAIEKNPKSVLAYFNLGNVLAHQGRFDEAEAAFRKVLEIDPKHFLASWNVQSIQLYKKS